MGKIMKIETQIPRLPARKRVAAYARVSMETERLHHSLAAQVSYYSELIQKNPEWEYAGVYADEGISGTTVSRRPEFTRMIADCDAGKIDIILTKSISRFARNTVDLLETVRHLKELGISVRFEKESIDSLSGDGELMLTILASYAQAEVENMSQNIKWAVRKNFQSGRLNGCCSFLGYRWNDTEKKLVAVPEEAEIVRKIFSMYLGGYSLQRIVNSLEEDGITGVRGGKLQRAAVSKILHNITYTGNLILQKRYTKDPLTKKERKNNGELPMYYVSDSHEAIVDMETFTSVQKRLEHMAEIGNSEVYEVRPFTRKIICGVCGSHYTREQSNKGNGIYYLWSCWKAKTLGSKSCTGRRISEIKLKAYSCDVLGMNTFDAETFRTLVEKIVINGDTLEFHLYDGTRKDVEDVKRRHYTGSK